MTNFNDTMDYKVILIDSSNAHFKDTPSKYSFYVNLTEPLRDVYKIKIVYSALSIPSGTLSDTSLITNLDSVFIDLNNYNRLATVLKNSKNILTNISYFDSIVIDTSDDKKATGLITIYNDFNSSENEYYVNPILSQLSRLDINLYDKNNDILTSSIVSRFVMKINIYYNNCKSTRA